MPFSPKQRQGGKEVDASLYVVATSMGVAESELEKLLAGRASVGIAKKLGVSKMDLQRFIAGEVSMTMAYALGMLQPQAQDLRDYLEREGAIGIIIGMCAKAPQRQTLLLRVFTSPGDNELGELVQRRS